MTAGKPWRSALLLALLLSSTTGSLFAQPETRPIRLLVPFEPGGQVDLMARLVAENLSKQLGRPIVADNRPGASGLIAMQIAMNAPPDGNTLVYGSASTLALLPHVSQKQPYDPIRDFTGISLVATSPYVLVVNASSPARSVSGLIKLARASPGTLTYGTAGHLAGTHVTTELFSTMAGISLVHVPYKGSGPATIALLGGQVSLLFNNLLPSLPHIASGKLRALGVTTLSRNRALPDVPTIAEAGVAGYESGAWNGLVAPGKPPRRKIDELYKGVVAAFANPELRASTTAQGSEIIASTPEEFAEFIKRENVKWTAVVRRIKVKS